MASKNKPTKYTFKGKVTGENKYANIYDELKTKEDIFRHNTIKKIHQLPEGEQEPVEDIMKNTRVVTSVEAEENARNRKEYEKIAKQKAMSKSSPVYVRARGPELDRIETLERLKREKNIKKALESGELNDEEKEILINDPNFIRETAKDRVNMDKSEVEIYKEYSDFDRVVPLTEYPNAKKDDVDLTEKKKVNFSELIKNDKVSLKDLQDYFEIEDDIPDFKDIVRKEGMDADSLKKRERMRVSDASDSVRDMENAASEILRRKKLDEEYDDIESSSMLGKTGRFNRLSEPGMDEQERKEKLYEENMLFEESGSSRRSRKASKNRDNKKDKENRSIRADVYRQNSESKIRRPNYLKIFLILVAVVCVVAYGASKIEEYMSKTSSEPSKKVVTQTAKKDPKKTSSAAKDTKPVADEKQKYIDQLKAAAASFDGKEAQEADYIIKNPGTYPTDLIKLAVKNPETVDFVYSYKDREKYNSRKLGDNVSSSYYVDGTVPLFLQWDRRWGYRDYGKEMMGLAGCGPTSLAMVIRHFDKKSGINPYDVAQYSAKNGYLSPDNFTSWSLFEKGIKHYGLTSKDITPVEARMKRALDSGDILIASMKPGKFTERGHIIVIKGYDKNGNFKINDPNSIANTNKTWSFDTLKDDIRKIWGINTIDTPSRSERTSGNAKNDNKDKEDDPSIIQDIN